MFIPIFLALLGSAVAGIWDLFTTDIPDEVTDSMIALGVFYWAVESLKLGTIVPLATSIAVGVLFLAFGYVLYKTGQWGGGDAKLLGAIGFLIPIFKTSLFPLHFLTNVFVVGAVYTVLYAITVGLLYGSIAKFFKETPLYITLISIAIMVSAFFFERIEGEIIFLFGFLVLFFFYAKYIEKNVFVRRIPVSKLKVGDVLLSSKEWVGITEKELTKIKRKYKYVKVKEGVRFGIVFFFALIATFLYGNLLFLLM